MKTRRLGRTGLAVSEVGVGGWVFGDAAQRDRHQAVIRRALDAGINLVDTAPGYKASEETIGETLTGGLRDRVVLSSKYYPYGEGDKVNLDPGALTASVDRSLEKLKTDRLDILHLHWVHSAEDVRRMIGSSFGTALRRLQAAGKVRALAISEASELDGEHAMLQWTLPQRFFDVVMVAYNVLFQTADKGVLELARQADAGVLVMMPLNQATAGSGLVSKEAADENVKRLVNEKLLPDEPPYNAPGALDILNQGTKLNVPQAALRWVLDRKEISCALVGTTNPAHLDEALAAMDAPPLAQPVHDELRYRFGRIKKQIK